MITMTYMYILFHITVLKLSSVKIILFNIIYNRTTLIGQK